MNMQMGKLAHNLVYKGSDKKNIDEFLNHKVLQKLSEISIQNGNTSNGDSFNCNSGFKIHCSKILLFMGSVFESLSTKS